MVAGGGGKVIRRGGKGKRGDMNSEQYTHPVGGGIAHREKRTMCFTRKIRKLQKKGCWTIFWGKEKGCQRIRKNQQWGKHGEKKPRKNTLP